LNIFKGMTINIRLVSLVIIFLIPIFIIYQPYRVTGEFPNLFTFFQNPKNLFYFWEIFLRFDPFINTLKVINEFNFNNIDLQYLKYIIQFFTLFFPRFIWEDKPLNINRDLQNFFVPSGFTEQSSTYYFAEAFLSFYFLGPIIYGAVQGIFIAILDNTYAYYNKNTQYSFLFLYFYSLSIFLLDFSMEGYSGMRTQLLIAYYILTLCFSIFFTRVTKS